MKTTASIIVLFAVVAFVRSTPLPQDAAAEVAPNRPLFNAFSAAANTANVAFEGLTNTGFNVAKTVAENTGRFIDNTAGAMSNGINSAAHSITSGLTRPFQSAQVENVQ